MMVGYIGKRPFSTTTCIVTSNQQYNLVRRGLWASELVSVTPVTDALVETQRFSPKSTWLSTTDQFDTSNPVAFRATATIPSFNATGCLVDFGGPYNGTFLGLADGIFVIFNRRSGTTYKLSANNTPLDDKEHVIEWSHYSDGHVKAWIDGEEVINGGTTNSSTWSGFDDGKYGGPNGATHFFTTRWPGKLTGDLIAFENQSV